MFNRYVLALSRLQEERDSISDYIAEKNERLCEVTEENIQRLEDIQNVIDLLDEEEEEVPGENESLQRMAESLGLYISRLGNIDLACRSSGI